MQVQTAIEQPNAADLVIFGKGDRFGAAISTGDAGGPVTARPIIDMLIGAPGVSTDSAGAGYLIFGQPEFGSTLRQVDLSSRAADFTVRGDDRQRMGVVTAIGDLMVTASATSSSARRAAPGQPASIPNHSHRWGRREPSSASMARLIKEAR